eukprot:6388334-Amphidinium_carterae.1
MEFLLDRYGYWSQAFNQLRNIFVGMLVVLCRETPRVSSLVPLARSALCSLGKDRGQSILVVHVESCNSTWCADDHFFWP